MNVDFNPRVNAMQTLAGGIRLLATDILCSVQELPVKVTEIDNIIVHDPKFPYAGGSEVKSCWRAEAAGTNAQHARVL